MVHTTDGMAGLFVRRTAWLLTLLVPAAGCVESEQAPAEGDVVSTAAQPVRNGDGALQAGSQAPERRAPRADGTVSRFVVLDEPGAIASLPRSLDPSSAAARQQIAKRAKVLRARHEALRPALEQAGAHIVADLVLVANAIQIRVEPKALRSIARLPGVARLDTPTHVTPELAFAAPLIGAPAVWTSGAGLRGQGMRIGVVDTGIDYLHADLGGAGDPAAYTADDHAVVEGGSFPTARVIGGRDFAGDDYDSRGYSGSPTPTPDDDPIDCGGHGTHVAGIAAGSGVLTNGTTYAGPWDGTLDSAAFTIMPGVAPEASLYSFKIFGCEGASDLVAAALELAVDPNEDDDVGDRVDVVNASIGSDFASGSETEAAAVAALTAAGSLFVAAAGNASSGYRAHFTASFPASAVESLSVGATLKQASTSSYLALEVTAPEPVAGTYPVGQASVGPTIAELGSLEGALVAADPIEGCDAIVNADEIAGAIGLVRRGACSFVAKAESLADAGAVGMIFVDNAPNDFPLNPFGGGSEPPDIPMFSLRQADGEALIAASPLEVSIAEGQTATVTVGPDYMAYFSSRGPTADLVRLKPELSAPGWNILSAQVGSGTAGVAKSGTSMATPVVAGAAALLRQGRPTLGPAELKEIMTSTARPVVDGMAHSFPTDLAGAGRLQIDDALDATISARVDGEPGEIGISFGAILATNETTVERDVIVTNRGSSAVDLDVTANLDIEWPGLAVAVAPSTLNVGANATGTATLTITIDPAALPPAPTYDGFTPPNTQIEYTSVSDAPNHHLIEATGKVSFTRDGENEPAAVVPYQAIVRPATTRSAGAVTGCAPGAGDARLELTGAPLAQGQATSVVELGTESSSFSDPTGPDASRDIVAVGALRDPAGERVHFAVVVAGDWTTPAQSWDSQIGVEVDTDNDQEAEYLVLTEAFRRVEPAPFGQSYHNAPMALVVDLASQSVVTTTVEPLNGVLAAYPTDFFSGEVPAYDTQLFFNNVAVLPVELDDLDLDSEDAAPFAYRGVSRVSRYPFLLDQPLDEPLDTTDWVPFDARASSPHLALPGSAAQNAVVIDDDGGIELTLPAYLPQLLVLHHSNAAQPRHEIVDPSGGTFEGSDLAVQVAAGDPVTLGDPASATITVSNSADSARTGVTLAVTAAGGAITSLDPSAGSCAAQSCELGTLSAGATVTVEVAGMPSAVGNFEVIATVASALGCETDATNDEATGAVTVTAGEGGGGGGGAEPVPPAANHAEGGCDCRTRPESGHPRGVLAGLLLGLAALGRRRSRQRR